MLADRSIHYHKPLSREPRAIAHVANMVGDLSVLAGGHNARVTLKSQLFDANKPVAEFSGEFVVLAE